MKTVLKKGIYLLLLPIFFVLHEYYFYYPAVPIKEVILILIRFLISAVILFSFSFLIYKRSDKAAFYAFILLFIFLFFGALFDSLKQSLGETFFNSYTFIIPILLVFLSGLAIIIKRRKPITEKYVRYINLIIIILIVFDTAYFTLSYSQKEDRAVKVAASQIKLKITNPTYKPDIYLLITDEYAGMNALKVAFDYDNSRFVCALNDRGFRVLHNTRSNYNATIFSMSSMLNLNYLQLHNNNIITLQNTLECGNILNENTFVKFLKSHGYIFYNNSLFDIADQPKAIRVYFFPTFEELFTSQTFIKRIKRDIGYNFLSAEEKIIYEKHNLNNDSIVDVLTRNILKQSASPKFVYTHFNMPHHPYFFNADTNNMEYGKLNIAKDQNKVSYIGYLEFANKKILNLIDFIKSHSSKPPVILLMSDHGWRKNETPSLNELQFENINAIHLPDSNYRYFYDGMSNVNQFRMLLNTYFAQNLPRLKDTTYFLSEEVSY